MKKTSINRALYLHSNTHTQHTIW